MKRLQHSNVVGLLHHCEDPQRVFLVTSLCSGGSLQSRILASSGLREADVQACGHQILQGLEYLHSVGIAHRDIKPENCMLARLGPIPGNLVRLVDFGTAGVFSPGDAAPFSLREGTPEYVAPEVVLGSYGPRCDVWSAGVVAYVSLCRQLPFDGSTREVVNAVSAGRYSMEGLRWVTISEEARRFVRLLMTPDPLRRPAASEALRVPWLAVAMQPVLLGKAVHMGEATRKYVLTGEATQPSDKPRRRRSKSLSTGDTPRRASSNSSVLQDAPKRSSSKSSVLSNVDGRSASKEFLCITPIPSDAEVPKDEHHSGGDPELSLEATAELPWLSSAGSREESEATRATAAAQSRGHASLGLPLDASRPRRICSDPLLGTFAEARGLSVATGSWECSRPGASKQGRRKLRRSRSEFPSSDVAESWSAASSKPHRSKCAGQLRRTRSDAAIGTYA